jgi:acetyl esterase/lipase
VRSREPSWLLSTAPSPPDLRVPYGPAASQFGELRLPRGVGPHPVVVALHGGFWRVEYGLEHMGHLCDALTVSGVATWNVEYRRVGEEGGGWPGTLDDVRDGLAVIETLAARYPLDLGRIVVVGNSAGGQLALWLAARAAIRLGGVVSLAGLLDLEGAWRMKLGGGIVETFLGGPPSRVPERYADASPLALLPCLPTLLVHGSADDVVPCEVSRTYKARAGAAARLLLIAGAGHLDLIDPRAAAGQRVVDEVLSLLGATIRRQ